MNVINLILIASSVVYLSAAMAIEEKKANLIRDLSEKAKCRDSGSFEIRGPGRLGVAMNQYAVPGQYGYVLQYNVPSYASPYGYVQYRPPSQYGSGYGYGYLNQQQQQQQQQPQMMQTPAPTTVGFPMNLFGKKK
jgi:hypothetical protein